jgi:hypothetical protein
MRNVIVTEDTTSGREFYQLLVDKGIFSSSTIVRDSSYGQTKAPDVDISGGMSNMKTAIARLHSDGELRCNDRLVLVLDMRLPIKLFVKDNQPNWSVSPKMERQEEIEHTQLNSFLDTLTKEGVIVKKIRAFCWESILLSYVDLLSTCEFGSQFPPETVESYKKLSKLLERTEYITTKNNAAISSSIPALVRVFGYIVCRKKPQTRSTIEDCFCALLSDITCRGDRDMFRFNKEGATNDKIGICWKYDCGAWDLSDSKKARCDYCEMVRVRNKRLSADRLAHLVGNSQIRRKFAIWCL